MLSIRGIPIKSGMTILMSNRPWIVVSVDEKKRELLVESTDTKIQKYVKEWLFDKIIIEAPLILNNKYYLRQDSKQIVILIYISHSETITNFVRYRELPKGDVHEMEMKLFKRRYYIC